MITPRRSFEAGDLLLGDDHEFVVNIYVALLRRWPDPAGYRSYLDQVRGHPERRLDVLREMAGSEEARAAGTRLELAEGAAVVPSDPRRALGAMLELRTEVLQDEIARLRAVLTDLVAGGGAEIGLLGGEILDQRDAELRAEIAALRTVAAPVAPAALPTAADLADYVADLVGAAEQRLEARVRAIEARLLGERP